MGIYNSMTRPRDCRHKGINHMFRISFGRILDFLPLQYNIRSVVQGCERGNARCELKRCGVPAR